MNAFNFPLDTPLAAAYVFIEHVQMQIGGMMNRIVITYLLYLAMSAGLTTRVAKILFRNGRVFLVDVFHSDEGLADSVNHLPVVGFDHPCSELVEFDFGESGNSAAFN